MIFGETKVLYEIGSSLPVHRQTLLFQDIYYTLYRVTERSLLVFRSTWKLKQNFLSHGKTVILFYWDNGFLYLSGKTLDVP